MRLRSITMVLLCTLSKHNHSKIYMTKMYIYFMTSSLFYRCINALIIRRKVYDKTTIWQTTFQMYFLRVSGVCCCNDAWSSNGGQVSISNHQLDQCWTSINPNIATSWDLGVRFSSLILRHWVYWTLNMNMTISEYQSLIHHKQWWVSNRIWPILYEKDMCL